MLLHDGVAQLMKPTRSSFSTVWLSWGGSEAARSKDDRTGAGSARDERPAMARASGRGRVACERDGGWVARRGPGRTRATARERTVAALERPGQRDLGRRRCLLVCGEQKGAGFRAAALRVGFFSPREQS